MAKKIRKTRVQAVKNCLVECLGGPFKGHKISMTIGQTDTLVFRIKKGDFGSYHREYLFTKTATWVREGNK